MPLGSRSGACWWADECRSVAGLAIDGCRGGPVAGPLRCSIGRGDGELADIEVGQDGRAEGCDCQSTGLHSNCDRRAVGDGRGDLWKQDDTGGLALATGRGETSDQSGWIGDLGDVRRQDVGGLTRGFGRRALVPVVAKVAKMPSVPGFGGPEVGGLGSLDGNTASVVVPVTPMAASWPQLGVADDVPVTPWPPVEVWLDVPEFAGDPGPTRAHVHPLGPRMVCTPSV